MTTTAQLSALTVRELGDAAYAADALPSTLLAGYEPQPVPSAP